MTTAEKKLDFIPTIISSKDAEMLLARRFNIEEICRYFGVPQAKVMTDHIPEPTP